MLLLKSRVTIDEIREAFRECFPAIEELELENMMLILQARIFINRVSKGERMFWDTAA